MLFARSHKETSPRRHLTYGQEAVPCDMYTELCMFEAPLCMDEEQLVMADVIGEITFTPSELSGKMHT